MLKNGRIIYLFSIIALLLTVSCGTGNVYVNSSLKEINPKKCAIVGFDFKDEKGVKNIPHISDEFSDAISVYLLQSGFSVIERSRIDLVLKELRLQQSGITGADEAIRVGRLANVRFVVFGTGRLDRTGSEYFLHEVTVKMIDIESGEIVIMASWSGSGVRPIGVANEIGKDIRKAFAR